MAQSHEAPDRSCALRAWLPLAFAYRRSADEELYFAVANAIRGLPFDRSLLLSKRGEAPPPFLRAPPADGLWHMPYAEVPFEYPALLLPFILLPAALAPSFEVFARLFGVLMAALIIASIQLAVLAAPRQEAADRASQWWCGAALLLAQGGIAVQRLDAVATLFLALSLWAAVHRRPGLMGFSVALAAAAKITPLLVVVVLCAADRETWRWKQPLARVASGVVLGLSIGFVPMLVMSPRGLVDFVKYHQARGLQVESTYGTLLALAKTFFGEKSAATLSFGSYNLGGRAAGIMANASSFVLLGAILGLGAWIVRANRGRSAGADQRRLSACAGLGAVLCIWLFGKVFSPQYLTWGIPFAVALQMRRITLLLIFAMATAQAYLRGFYDAVVAMQPLGVAALSLRTAILGILAVSLLCAIATSQREQEPSREPS